MATTFPVSIKLTITEFIEKSTTSRVFGIGFAVISWGLVTVFRRQCTVGVIGQKEDIQEEPHQ